MKSFKRILDDRPNLKIVGRKYYPWKPQMYKETEAFSSQFFFSIGGRPRCLLCGSRKPTFFFTEGHHPSQSQGVVYRHKKSWQTYVFVTSFGKSRGEPPNVILCNRINDIHSSVEILLDGKAVGNHGCDDSYCLHLNRTSVEALALPQLLDLQVNLTDAKY